MPATASRTKLRRFRYGVQVNSLGLTEQQPENNVYRILIEMLAVVLSKKARARAVQLPAWNEAFGLPRPWDQQWSLRLQQIVAFETDVLDYDDIFDGSKAIDRKSRSAQERSARGAAARPRHGRRGHAANDYMKAGSSRRTRRASRQSKPASTVGRGECLCRERAFAAVARLTAHTVPSGRAMNRSSG